MRRSTDRQPSHSPPTPPYSPPRLPPARPSDRGLQGSSDAAAAAALELLRRAPEDVLARGRSESGPPAGAGGAGRRGRPSAAQLARERYAQMLQEAPPDLLDLSSPVASSAQAAAPRGAAPPEPASAAQVPPVATGSVAALPAAGPAAGLSSDLFRGETVLARYGPDGRFYRARVVQAYMRQGASLVDVVWLRPQAAASESEAAEYLDGQGRAATPDEARYQNGLQVGLDVHRGGQPPAAAPGGGGPRGPAPPARAAAGGPALAAGAPPPDLLDLQADSPARGHACGAAAAGFPGALAPPASGLPSAVPGGGGCCGPAAPLAARPAGGPFPPAGGPAQLAMGSGLCPVAGGVPAGMLPAASAAAVVPAPAVAEPFGSVVELSGARPAPADFGA